MAIRAATKPWAEVYREEPNGDQLIKSLLYGVEFRLRERMGSLQEHERDLPKTIDYGAFLKKARANKFLHLFSPAGRRQAGLIT